MSPASRRDASSKPAWFCRSCKLQDGQPARNFGDRTTCFRCRLAKGVCHGSNAPSSTPSRSANGNHAALQTSLANKAQAEKMARLLKENSVLRKSLGQQAVEISIEVPGGAPTTPVFVDASQDADVNFTDEQLQAHRKMYLSQGVSEHNPLVKNITEQLKSRSDAKMADKPGHIRLAKTAKAVSQCKAAVDAAALGRCKLVAEIAAVQARLVLADAKAESLRNVLADAERDHEELLTLLHTDGPGGRPPFPPVAGMQLGVAAAQLEAGSEADWAKLGFTIDKQSLIAIFRTLEASHAGKSPAESAHAVPVPGGDSTNEGLDEDAAAPSAAGAAGSNLFPPPHPSAGPAADGGGPGDDLDDCMSVDDVLSVWEGTSASNRQQLAQELVDNMAKRRCLTRARETASSQA
jgi:hypothetical protein